MPHIPGMMSPHFQLELGIDPELQKVQGSLWCCFASAAEDVCWECREGCSWQILTVFVSVAVTVHTQLETFLVTVGWSALVHAAFSPLGP